MSSLGNAGGRRVSRRKGQRHGSACTPPPCSSSSNAVITRPGSPRRQESHASASASSIAIPEQAGSRHRALRQVVLPLRARPRACQPGDGGTGFFCSTTGLDVLAPHRLPLRALFPFSSATSTRASFPLARSSPAFRCSRCSRTRVRSSNPRSSRSARRWAGSYTRSPGGPAVVAARRDARHRRPPRSYAHPAAPPVCDADAQGAAGAEVRARRRRADCDALFGAAHSVGSRR